MFGCRNAGTTSGARSAWRSSRTSTHHGVSAAPGCESSSSRCVFPLMAVLQKTLVCWTVSLTVFRLNIDCALTVCLACYSTDFGLFLRADDRAGEAHRGVLPADVPQVRLAACRSLFALRCSLFALCSLLLAPCSLLLAPCSLLLATRYSLLATCYFPSPNSCRILLILNNLLPDAT